MGLLQELNETGEGHGLYPPAPRACSHFLHTFLTPSPHIVCTLLQVTELLEKGGASQPDVIEAAFTAVCTLFKHLAQHLTADLPAALRVTAPLRYSAAAGHHVRVFAAQAAGGLGGRRWIFGEGGSLTNVDL